VALGAGAEPVATLAVTVDPGLVGVTAAVSAPDAAPLPGSDGAVELPGESALPWGVIAAPPLPSLLDEPEPLELPEPPPPPLEGPAVLPESGPEVPDELP
jgi:hypothetical protein